VATLATLRTSVYTKMGIPTTDGLLTSTKVNAFINEALNQLEGEGIWQWQEATETLSAVVTNATLTPSSTNYGRTVALTIPGGDPLELKPIAFLDKLVNASGPPVFYGFWAGQLLIRPKADASYSFTHRYLKREVALVADGDTPLVPDRWSPAVVEYAASLAYRSMNDADNAARCVSAYQDWVRRATTEGVLKADEQGGGIPSGLKPMDDDD